MTTKGDWRMRFVVGLVSTEKAMSVPQFSLLNVMIGLAHLEVPSDFKFQVCFEHGTK